MNKNIASKIFNVTIGALIACIWIFFLWTKYDRQFKSFQMIKKNGEKRE